MAGWATQIRSHRYAMEFGRLPAPVRVHIQRKVDEMGRRLGSFPHVRMSGCRKFRIRIGDYRAVYFFDEARNEIELLSVGHRGQVYR